MQRSRFLVLLAAVACSSASSTTETRPARAPRPASDLITREEIETRAKGLSSGYEIVEALHGNWLRARSGTGSAGRTTLPAPAQRTDSGARNPYSTMTGSSTRDTLRSELGAPAGIQVYLDGIRMGGLGELKRIPAQGIHSIRHYTGTEAQTRFGPGHSDGVIAVSTRPDPR
ncbi:MAG TPA: hypothetical protein VFT29_12525 [Gemmatimonadaceae bacterium]|nr:hypothetical protein [Gemmatimonadaceae bacterium]